MEVLKNQFLNIWNLINNEYVLFKEKNINWDDIKKIYIDRIEKRTYFNIYNIIEDLITELEDPHTKFIRSNHISQYFSPVKIYNLTNNDYYVISNDKKSSNIPTGSKLISVNGVSMEKLLTKIKNKYNYQSENLVKSQLINSLTTSVNKEIFKFEVTNGEFNIKETVEFKRLSEIMDLSKHTNIKSSSVVFSNILDNNIAYIKPLNFMVRSSTDEILKKLSVMGQCDKLIVDLRVNSGGLIDEAKRFSGLFINKPTIIGYQQTNKNCFLEKICIQPSIDNVLDKFKKIVFLCDKETMSSAEFIVLKTIYENTNIPIIGTKTAGMPHSATVFNLNDGSKLLVTTIKYFDKNKFLIQEDGISPNIEISNDISLILKGEDKQLKYAISYCNK